MYKIIDIFDNNKIFQCFALFGLYCYIANRTSSALQSGQWIVEIPGWVFSQLRKAGKRGRGRDVVLFSC